MESEKQTAGHRSGKPFGKDVLKLYDFSLSIRPKVSIIDKT